MSTAQTCGTHAPRTRQGNRKWQGVTRQRPFDFHRVNLKPNPTDIKAACLMAWAMVKAEGLDTLDRCCVEVSA